LILSTFIASAESITDGTGDVYHWTGTENAWSWKQNNIRNDIDITEISSSINGDNITITLKVAGTVQTTEKFAYYCYYNTSDTNYWVMATGGNAIAMATSQGEGGGSYTQGTAVINDNTVTAEFEILGDTEAQEIWGWAVEWTEVGDSMNHEWWGDWAPNTKFTGTISEDDTGDDDTSEDDTDNSDTGSDNQETEKTPGFEVIAVIATIGLALILFKRRK